MLIMMVAVVLVVMVMVIKAELLFFNRCAFKTYFPKKGT